MEQHNKGVKIDRISFQLGMINCFAEMVACGVKKLALSPPLTPGDYRTVGPFSKKIVEGFGIKSFLEKNLLITGLQSEKFTRNKWSVLYFKTDDVLDAYLALKEKKRRLEEKNDYDGKAERDVSREFMRLLSYPDDVIQEKLNRGKADESPFMLIDEE